MKNVLFLTGISIYLFACGGGGESFFGYPKTTGTDAGNTGSFSNNQVVPNCFCPPHSNLMSACICLSNGKDASTSSNDASTSESRGNNGSPTRDAGYITTNNLLDSGSVLIADGGGSNNTSTIVDASTTTATQQDSGTSMCSTSVPTDVCEHEDCNAIQATCGSAMTEENRNSCDMCNWNYENCTGLCYNVDAGSLTVASNDAACNSSVSVSDKVCTYLLFDCYSNIKNTSNTNNNNSNNSSW